MAASGLDPDEANVPWGKYSYNLEGLASGCYMEGLDPNPRPTALQGKRLRFRVELPARCFVLSVGIKLPNAPRSALHCLEDVVIERGLNGDFHRRARPGHTRRRQHRAVAAQSRHWQQCGALIVIIRGFVHHVSNKRWYQQGR